MNNKDSNNHSSFFLSRDVLTHTTSDQIPLNLHSHVKIHLSTDRTRAIDIDTQLRLIRMRENCPGDKIYLAYDSKLVNDNAINDLKIFCKKHFIMPLNIQEIIYTHE